MFVDFETIPTEPKNTRTHSPAKLTGACKLPDGEPVGFTRSQLIPLETVLRNFETYKRLGFYLFGDENLPLSPYEKKSILRINIKGSCLDATPEDRLEALNEKNRIRFSGYIKTAILLFNTRTPHPHLAISLQNVVNQAVVYSFSFRDNPNLTGFLRKAGFNSQAQMKTRVLDSHGLSELLHTGICRDYFVRYGNIRGVGMSEMFNKIITIDVNPESGKMMFEKAEALSANIPAGYNSMRLVYDILKEGGIAFKMGLSPNSFYKNVKRYVERTAMEHAGK